MCLNITEVCHRCGYLQLLTSVLTNRGLLLQGLLLTRWPAVTVERPSSSSSLSTLHVNSTPTNVQALLTLTKVAVWGVRTAAAQRWDMMLMLHHFAAPSTSVPQLMPHFAVYNVHVPLSNIEYKKFLNFSALKFLWPEHMFILFGGCECMVFISRNIHGKTTWRQWPRSIIGTMDLERKKSTCIFN